jgi:acetyltransferase-like isoleucine patch superfamily enzyme
MKNIIQKLFRKFSLLIINSLLSTTRFFKLKRILLNLSGMKIGKETKVVGPLYIGTVAQLSIGDECWIGSGFKVYGNGEVIIGDKCDFAPDVAFVTGSHEIGDEERRAGQGVSYVIEVGNGCWIGARVTILGNIKVSNSSVIGTCSLLNKSIPSNVIAVGVPAKIIRHF